MCGSEFSQSESVPAVTYVRLPPAYYSAPSPLILTVCKNPVRFYLEKNMVLFIRLHRNGENSIIFLLKMKNGTPHSRYFSDELGVPIFSKNAELVFAIYRNIGYNSNMGKEIFIIKENTLSYGRGYVYSLQYHLVWCTKYRKQVLKNGIDAECKKMLYGLAEEYKFKILAMEVMPDHIHLLLDCKPQFFISDMINIMKGNLARQLFLSHPELKQELWGGHLWNPSYCAVTVSDRSRDQVMAYIEGQKEKEERK